MVVRGKGIRVKDQSAEKVSLEYVFQGVQAVWFGVLMGLGMTEFCDCHWGEGTNSLSLWGRGV